MNKVTTHVNIQIVDSPEEAPTYNTDVTMVKMETCIIVGNGTVDGAPTVDIQLVDKDNKKYLIMLTGNLLEMIAGAARGKREADEIY